EERRVVILSFKLLLIHHKHAKKRGFLLHNREGLLLGIHHRVRPREFKEGDLVLKKILSFQPDSRGKWTPNYEGPYIVKRVFSGGAMILATMDGDELPRPVNADAVKKYFV
ncbi:hypothetical protein L195_g039844, partial [Trifolium pratense]